MTDNEKAASFIWKPEDGCQCDGCTGYSNNCHDSLVCQPPDMTKPQNYTRALAKVEQEGYDYEHIFKHPDIHYLVIGHGFWYDGGIKDECSGSQGPDFAKVVVTALARLYDFEEAQK